CGRPPRPPLFPYPTLFRSPTAAYRNHDRLDRGGCIQHFQRNSSLARDDRRMVERRDELGPGSLDELERCIKRLLESTPLEHDVRSEEHTSELQSRENLVCR